MDKKILFFDIDGTILTPGEGIRRTVQEALQEARSRGHKVLIATGRVRNSLPEEAERMELDGLIASAGSDIWLGGRNVYRTSLPEALVKRACAYLSSLDAVCMLEGFTRIYVSEKGRRLLDGQEPVPGDNPELIRWKRFFGQKDNVDPLEKWIPERDPIPKIAFIVWREEDLERIQRELGDLFQIAVFPRSSGIFRNGELISRTADKGAAVRRVASLLGADMADTVAFGDSMNDYSMIQAAGTGVVMENGDEELKAAADRICESVREDGVVRELERMGLIAPRD